MRETQKIKRLFSIAFLVTFIIICTDYFLLRQFMTTQDHSASMINISGRQRMLSQRTIIWSERLLDASSDKEREAARKSLQEISQEMRHANYLLTDAHTHIGEVTQSNETLKAVYFSSPIHLNQQIHNFTKHIIHLASAPNNALNHNNKDYQFITATANAKLLEALELAVATHESQNLSDLRMLHISSIALFIGALLMLAGLFWFVFRPLIRSVNNTLRLMELQQKVTIAANETDSIEECLQFALDTICSHMHWQIGHVFAYDEEKKKLSSMHIWHCTEGRNYSDFIHASEEITFAPATGLIGEVFTNAQPMWILDIANSAIYLRKTAAHSAQLNATFAFPIFVGRKVVAVIEFCATKSHAPSASLQKVMANIGKQLGQAFERAQFEERAQLLETIISSANDGIIITKADLEAPGPEIIYVNAAFTEISGYSAEEAIGKSPRFLQSEFTKQETLAELRQALNEGKAFKDELLNQHKNGDNYWLDISIVPIKNTQGVITHFAAIERDITAKKKEELNQKNMWLQLKRANLKVEAAARDLQESLTKAEEASKAKSDFLANMSHELRTPMNGVLGMAHLLADTRLDTEQKEFVSTINGSAENLLMLLNDILDFSKIEAGALQLENIAYSFYDATYNTANLLRPQAEKKKVELLLDYEQEIPAYIWGDSGRVKQVIMNLLGNAIKFTEHGYVRLSAKLQESSDAHYIMIHVQDTGLGIPAHKLDMIFDKFTQGDTSITRKYGGTGLGLAITKHLVNLMGGDIGVESAEGKGSTFWFSVPCHAATKEDAINQKDHGSIRVLSTENALPIGQAKVLLVEDYPVNQVFAEKLLRKFGFKHIDMAENGLIALECFRHTKYDMIFMDCQMPELDGYQTTQKIRLIEEGTPQHTPIVAMTANAMMGDREKCLKAGMDDYLSKPLRAEHLKTIVQAWFILDDGTHPVTAPHLISTMSPSQHQNNINAPINIEQLRSFTDGDPDEEKALVALFLEQAEEMITIMENSQDSNACESWKSSAHRLKGSAGNLGAMHLHHLCKRAESEYTESAHKKMDMLNAIKQETKRIESFFAHYPS